MGKYTVAIRRPACLLVFLLVSAWVPTAAAQEHVWYAGATFASERIRFEPHYTFDDGQTRQFFNRITGLQTNLLVGQRFPRDARFTFGWQATLGMNGAKWTLHLPEEPADFEYSLPLTFTGSVVPEFLLGRLVSVFASVGGGMAHVREQKASPVTSTYDHDTYEPAWTIGGGLRIRAVRRADVIVQFDQLRVKAFEFDTFTAAGVHVEHLKDRPRARGLSIGGAVRF